MKAIAFGMLALVLAGLAVSTTYAGWGFGPSEDIQNAVESGDYDAWKDAMTDRISEDNFNEMVQRHQERSAHRAERQAVHDAMLAGDYDAYLEAVEDVECPRGTLTEDEFTQLSELRQNGEGFGEGPGMGEGFGRGAGRGHGMMAW